MSMRVEALDLKNEMGGEGGVDRVGIEAGDIYSLLDEILGQQCRDEGLAHAALSLENKVDCRHHLPSFLLTSKSTGSGVGS